MPIIKRLTNDDESAEPVIERLALEGLTSGEPIAADRHYWSAKHRSLDERLRNAGAM